jgi:hypothetical protein
MKATAVLAAVAVIAIALACNQMRKEINTHAHYMHAAACPLLCTPLARSLPLRVTAADAAASIDLTVCSHSGQFDRAHSSVAAKLSCCVCMRPASPPLPSPLLRAALVGDLLLVRTLLPVSETHTDEVRKNITAQANVVDMHNNTALHVGDLAHGNTALSRCGAASARSLD